MLRKNRSDRELRHERTASLNSRPEELVEVNKLRASPRQVLVDGGARYIGGHAVERPPQDGREDAPLDNFTRGTRNNFANMQQGWKIRVKKGDVREPPATRNALQGVSTFIHPAVGELNSCSRVALQEGLAPYLRRYARRRKAVE